MVNFTYKKELIEGLYNYLHVSNPYSDVTIPTLEIENNLYKYHFHYYVSLAVFLSSGLKSYVVCRYSPFLVKQPFVQIIEEVNWKYDLLSDDYNGLGIDKGFINAKLNAEEQLILFSVNDLMLLTDLPEDTLGENFWHFSAFCLRDNRLSSLKKFFQSSNTPALSEFLGYDEVFINIISSKANGYYDALLIKSRNDIKQTLNSFQPIRDPNN